MENDKNAHLIYKGTVVVLGIALQKHLIPHLTFHYIRELFLVNLKQVHSMFCSEL